MILRAEVARAILEIKERKTTAPSYLTESELIGLMEKMESAQVRANFSTAFSFYKSLIRPY